MPKLHRWNKWGKYWVWEGENLVVVGSRGSGYSVHEKGTVNIYKDRVTSRHRGYYGTYETRREALGYLKLVDKSMEEGRELFLEVSGGDPDEFRKGGAWTSYVPKTGAKIVIYHKDYPGDLYHEIEHERLGHVQTRVTPKQEVEVVGSTIKVLRERGLYTPEERERTIDMLSGYIRGKRSVAKVRAEEIVSKLEVDEEPLLEGVDWKVKGGRLT